MYFSNLSTHFFITFTYPKNVFQMLLYNAHIYTADKQFSTAQAL